MTDKETLLFYRLRQAQETLDDARKMLEQDAGPRSIINRSYYSMFYAVLALILSSDIRLKTSRHAGIISAFDRDFIRSGKIDKHFSEVLHYAFDSRLDADYREMVDPTREEAIVHVENAAAFLECIKGILADN